MNNVLAHADQPTLQVFHLPQPEGTQNSFFEVPNSWKIETCQRTVWVRAENLDETHFTANAQKLPERMTEQMLGTDAYEFLLQLACGLKSALLGEADVFGQLKESWGQWQKSARSSSDLTIKNQSFLLESWVQRLFEDAKEIRTRHLQNLGSQTYGCLSRQILRNIFSTEKTLSNKPTLLLGAGQLAQSVTPMLWSLNSKENLISEFWIWNRSPERLDQWLSSWPTAIPVNKLPSINEMHTLMNGKSLGSVVCFLPDDEQITSTWAKLLSSLDSSIPILYLGSLFPQSPIWSARKNFFTLSDVLRTQTQMATERANKIKLAGRVCNERARLRTLIPSMGLGVPHSWEDLAFFSA